MLLNIFIEQNHLYFSFNETKEQINKDRSKKYEHIFIHDFYKISKETYLNNQ